MTLNFKSSFITIIESHRLKDLILFFSLNFNNDNENFMIISHKILSEVKIYKFNESDYQNIIIIKEITITYEELIVILDLLILENKISALDSMIFLNDIAWKLISCYYDGNNNNG
jgi:hypothetical protein